MGTPSPQADEMAQMMLEAVNKNAWDQTRFVAWTYRGGHNFLWDKTHNLVQVQWKDKVALIDLNKLEGYAFEAGKPLSEEKKGKVLHQGWLYFCNDSFWLNAVTKAFDPGTERSLVTTADGRTGLKVSYTSGGATPGDSYVWLLDENHRPLSWKMWTGLIPIGGLEVTWEDWQQLPSGAWIAKNHKYLGRSLPVTNLKTGQQLEDLELSENPFEVAGMY